MMQPIYVEIGGRIECARRSRGVPEIELAKQCGFTTSMLGMWRRAERRIQLHDLQTLAAALAVSFVWLATGQTAADDTTLEQVAAVLARQASGVTQQALDTDPKLLTSFDPEPPVGTIVAIGGGSKWVSLRPNCWVDLYHPSSSKTWGGIADGPVTICQ